MVKNKYFISVFLCHIYSEDPPYASHCVSGRIKAMTDTVPAFIELSFMYVCVYDRSLDKK